jgi:hypothetical protein
MLLSVALFQGIRGLFVSFWPPRWIGFSPCFEPSLSNVRIRSEPLWEMFPEGSGRSRQHLKRLAARTGLEPVHRP